VLGRAYVQRRTLEV